VTVSPKLMFDAALATLVAVWLIGGRAIYRGLDLDVFLVQATAILTFLFLCRDQQRPALAPPRPA